MKHDFTLFGGPGNNWVHCGGCGISIGATDGQTIPLLYVYEECTGAPKEKPGLPDRVASRLYDHTRENALWIAEIHVVVNSLIDYLKAREKE
jgi:hypothetical protein